MTTSSPGVVAPVVPGPGTTARRDLALVVLLSIAAAILCAKLNIGEALLSWTRPREAFQLDELPDVLLAFAAGLVWFSARRYREARNEIDLRRRAEADLQAALSENRRLAQQYVDMQEAERKALARDLHDELGQYLNAIKLDAVSVRDRLAPLDPAGFGIAAGMIRSVDRVQSVVMGLIRQLRPVGLDELGLAAAIEHCVSDWRRRLPHISIELSISDILEGVDEMCRLALYRLVQEALTNVARHSHATRAGIRIAREPAGQIVASIEDDGVGADLTRPGSGLGLIGMRERAEALGGSLTLASVPRGGFTVLARIPIERVT